MSRCILWTACFFISLCWGSASSFLSVRADDGLEPLIAFLGVGGTGSEVAHVIGFIRPDGTGEFFPDFHQDNQRSWVIGPLFADGRRLMLSSYEDTNLTQVRSGQVMTHDWIYDFQTGEVVATLQVLDVSDKCLHYVQELHHAQKGWLSAVMEALVIHVDMATRKPAPFPAEIQKSLLAVLDAHRALPTPRHVGSRIGIRRK